MSKSKFPTPSQKCAHIFTRQPSVAQNAQRVLSENSHLPNQFYYLPEKIKYYTKMTKLIRSGATFIFQTASFIQNTVIQSLKLYTVFKEKKCLQFFEE